MVDELFKSGTLELPAAPLTRPETAALWSDCLVNRILVIAALVVFLLSFGEIQRMYRKLADCVFRGSYIQQLERNLGEKRSRDLLAFLSILPFCLLMDRFGFYRCRFLDGVEPQWGVAVSFCVVLVWLVLHISIWAIARNIKAMRSHKDIIAAAHNSVYSYFIILVAFMVVSVGAMKTISLQDEVISTVLRWEIIVGYAFSVWRFLRFSMSYCSAFTTFLYLCTLEFLPAAAVVAGEIV